MNISNAIDPAARLRSFLEAAPRSLTSGPILLACSGGPDSAALVVAASRLRLKGSFSFLVAHVNHKLRGAESDRDAAFVVRMAKKWGLPFAVRVARVARGAGNLEEKARDRRYAALVALAGRRRSTFVLTAHTMDDQAETVFMNVLRGSGGNGLAGMPARRSLAERVEVGRPYLIFGREELHRWIDGFGVRAREDRSNRDERLLRNWLRRRLFPTLARRSPGFKERLAKLATLFRDENAFWDDFLTDVEKRVCRANSEGRLLDLGGLLSYSAAVQRRFLRRIVGENLLTFDAVERLRFWMMSTPTGGRTLQLRRGWIVTRLSKSKGAPSANLFLIKDENHK